ncbi:MAG: hypothetical protein LBP73_00850 [Clostridiales Family XIII bacterium]|nr:hypothetical protein [Clostridiales Family XIII bacterium]
MSKQQRIAYVFVLSAVLLSSIPGCRSDTAPYAGSESGRTTTEAAEPDDSSDDTRLPDGNRTYPQDLTEALAWEQMKANYEDTFWDIRGKSLKKLVEKRFYIWYGWTLDRGEVAFFKGSDWDAECILFSAPILSENAKCTAIAYDFKYAAPGWNGETAFSKEDVLRAGGDVKWIEREGSEPAYLEYSFDGLQTRVYTDDDGIGILRDRDIVLKDNSAEEMFGLQDVDIKKELFVRNGMTDNEKWLVLNRYISCIGKTKEEIVKMLGENFEFDNGRMKYPEGLSFGLSGDGLCGEISGSFNILFPDSEEGDGIEYIKALGVPFMYRMPPSLYEIHFEHFCIAIRADDDMNILTDAEVVIR